MNPIARSRLEAALKAEMAWKAVLDGEAAQISETIRAALEHLLNPEVTEGVYQAGINASYDDNNRDGLKGVYTAMIAELTKEDA
jgi:hypothetical protein